MHECQKSIQRRLHDPAFHQFYFVGDGIDIGGGYDGLENYRALFPRIRSVRNWDVKDGDAQLMAGVPDALYDFVHSSHCLEHMRDPYEAVRSWWRILKPKGHLVVLVPDGELYEQGAWPSTFNSDHKHTFTIELRDLPWSKGDTMSVLDLIAQLGPSHRVLSCRLLESTYIRGIQRCDQTQAAGECAIEFVLRKIAGPS